MDTVGKVKSPQVSILMLTYNRASYIGEAVRSVIEQSYQNWELFIIDDGSTDNTSEIVSQFTDSRIRYIRHEENAGLLARRQESLTLGTGTYTAVLDSDDVWSDPKKLEKQVIYLEANLDTVLVGTFITLIDESGNIQGTTSYAVDNMKIRRSILCRNQFAHSSVVMRKNALHKTAGYRFPLAEDLDLFLQLGHLGKMANLPEYVCSYRVHAGGETKKKVAMIDCVLSIIKTHKDQYPGYWCAKMKYSISKIISAYL
jgi:glycosyltransferase involved in cell wall biosynthesis